MDRGPRPAPGTLTTPGGDEAIVAAARLGWRGSQPYADAYQDIYHAEDGPGEVQRVFTGPSRLAEKARDKARQGQRLLLGELGFGTGLNFALAAEVCRQSGVRLHFVSFDLTPIAGGEFAAICRRRQNRHPIYRELRACYPPLIGGWHRRYLADGAITLSLFWGDAGAGLDDLIGRQRRPFDIWFLDGFAPDRNPAMWREELLLRIGELSGTATTVATYTAASRVRRGLEAAGFAMHRIDQRPHKPQSLAGEFRGEHLEWQTPATVHVAGAGLAGASSARHLAEQGIRVALFEAEAGPAAGASGIPATVLHPRLLGDGSTQAALRAHAYLYSTAYCATHDHAPPSGALQLPSRNADAGRLQQVAARYLPSGEWIELLPAEAASVSSGWNIATPALWFPDSRIIDTPGLCRTLLDHPAIETRFQTPLTALTSQPTILACGVACRRFAEATYLETAPVHGQVDTVQLQPGPLLPLLGGGYLVPHHGTVLAGTTYEYTPWDPEAATAANLAQLEGSAGNWRWLGRARATRCVSSDRTPIAGRLYARDQTPVTNAYVSTGHGSMGTVFSHFAGALVAGQISGDFPPMTRALESALSPLRFRLRQSRRGVRHSPDL